MGCSLISIGFATGCGLEISPTTQEKPGKQYTGTIFQTTPGSSLNYKVPITIAVSFIVARDGHTFVSLGAGTAPPSLSEESGVGSEPSVSMRDGWFGDPDAGNFTSAQIDSYIKGPYMSVSGSISPLSLAASVSKALPGGYSYEFGTQLPPSTGVGVQGGYTWQTSG